MNTGTVKHNGNGSNGNGNGKGNSSDNGNGNGKQGLHTIESIKQIRIPSEFIKTLQGKEFVLYTGLLDLAHQKGLCSISVDIIQYPSEQNDHVAICKAYAKTRNGEEFSDIGDASPSNTSKTIAPHIIRMASTRAKARALRDLTNIGITCLEELGDLNDVISDEKPVQEAVQETKDIRTLTEAQKQALYNLSRRRGLSESELEDLADQHFGVSIDSLSITEASTLIRQLQSAA